MLDAKLDKMLCAVQAEAMTQRHKPWGSVLRLYETWDEPRFMEDINGVVYPRIVLAANRRSKS